MADYSAVDAAAVAGTSREAMLVKEVEEGALHGTST